MTTQEHIHDLARTLSRHRADLAAKVTALNAKIEQAKDRSLPEIRELAAQVNEATDKLSDAITGNPDLFKSPKTQTAHGLRFGFSKAKGKVTFRDAVAVVKRIRQHMPKRLKDLVKITETPIKSALSKLSGDELKRLGVTVEDAGDEVTIKPLDSDIDKMVAALLDDKGD